MMHLMSKQRVLDKAIAAGRLVTIDVNEPHIDKASRHLITFVVLWLVLFATPQANAYDSTNMTPRLVNVSL
jgi:hypothetical protein